jgi:hypothetical protein
MSKSTISTFELFQMFPTRRELYQVHLWFLMDDQKVFPWWRWRYVRCWLGAKGLWR